MLHVIGEVLQLRFFGDDLLPGTDLAAYFESYLQDVVSDRSLLPRTELFGITAGSYGGLGYQQKETSEFKVLRSMVRDAVKTVQDENMREEAPRLIEELTQDQQKAMILSSRGDRRGSLQGIPVLHHVDPGRFAALLIDDSAPRETIMSALLNRYADDAGSRLLSVEHEWVRAVQRELASLVAMETPPYQKLLEYRVNWIARELGPVDV